MHRNPLMNPPMPPRNPVLDAFINALRTQSPLPNPKVCSYRTLFNEAIFQISEEEEEKEEKDHKGQPEAVYSTQEAFLERLYSGEEPLYYSDISTGEAEITEKFNEQTCLLAHRLKLEQHKEKIYAVVETKLNRPLADEEKQWIYLNKAEAKSQVTSPAKKATYQLLTEEVKKIPADR